MSTTTTNSTTTPAAVPERFAPGPGTRFTQHTRGSLSGRAGELLDSLFAADRGVSPMLATMAGSPATLAGYLDLSRAARRVSLSRRLSEQISIAVQATRGCDTCLDAHMAAARTAGVAEHDIELAQAGTASVAADAAMIEFALQVLIDPTAVGADTLNSLRQLGFSDRQILDVVALVTVNFMTGTFNLVAGL